MFRPDPFPLIYSTITGLFLARPRRPPVRRNGRLGLTVGPYVQVRSGQLAYSLST